MFGRGARRFEGGSKSNAAGSAVSLPALQDRVKRNPSAFRDEFFAQHRRLASEIAIARLQPTASSSTNLGDLVGFVAAVAPCYKKEKVAEQLSEDLVSLLGSHAEALPSELRVSIARALALLRNRGLLPPTALPPLFFKLMSVPDKALRKVLIDHLINDVKRINSNAAGSGHGGVGKDRVNRQLQSFYFATVRGDNSVAARRALSALVGLYRRRVWSDARTVNAIAEAALAEDTKLVGTALHFFLGIDEKMVGATATTAAATTTTTAPTIFSTREDGGCCCYRCYRYYYRYYHPTD